MIVANSFGKIFKITSFGESHGRAVGGIIEGFPAGVQIDFDFIQSELNKRKPGQSRYTTARKEQDNVNFLSGIFQSKTLGTPIAFIVENRDKRSQDYNNLADIFRPGHADYTYFKKYGYRDWRGGGRQSARETISRVVAGAFAKIILQKLNISVNAFVSQIGNEKLTKHYSELDLSQTYKSPVRCPDEKTSLLFENEIQKAMKNKDSVGGIVSCVVKNMPAGMGEPVFDKFHSVLGAAVLSINACKAFEIGKGFDVAQMYGSENNDQMLIENNKLKFLTNNSGGVIGGITTGQDIFFRAAFKPTPTIFKEQKTINKNNENIIFSAKGRHDPCVVPRATIIVEAMTAITILDFLMQHKAVNILRDE